MEKPILGIHHVTLIGTPVKRGGRYAASTRRPWICCSRIPGPGNIRDLENVIERSVIVCETETFSVDESWLSREAGLTQPASKLMSKRPVTEEKQIIEAALAEA